MIITTRPGKQINSGEITGSVAAKQLPDVACRMVIEVRQEEDGKVGGSGQEASGEEEVNHAVQV